MYNFVKFLLRTFLFWMLLFAFYRLIFVLYNLSYAGGASAGVLAQSFLVGLRLDMSMTGYVLMLLGVVQTISLLTIRKFSYRTSKGVVVFFIVAFTLLLLGNIHLYSYWGRLLDAEGFSFLKTPWVIIASVKWYESLAFLFLWLILTWVAIKGYLWWTRRFLASVKLGVGPHLLASFITLFIAASMLIPIRGSFGVAPINTGVAYFSGHNYANHAAINPLWNLFYSFKRMDARMHHYRFMADEEAQAIYHDMFSSQGDSTIQVLRHKRPNVVVILLESFSAQVVGALGGEKVTPNLDALAREGILFSHVYAASDRSDKGLVATLAGYQVLPGYSIIQYPNKSQSLPFLPQKLKGAGYHDLSYIYGGDIGFKGMNSFVTLSGFDHVITIDDFPYSARGEKWGVHDEYTFNRLLEEMTVSNNKDHPFFKYYFTLSSHEPFDVPMEQVMDEPYLNSVHYTDRCLGDFFTKVKERGLWDNTLFVLIADHGTPGPKRATSQMVERYHIPMVWTGGALAVKDTVVTTMGSQRDLVTTLLKQLAINPEMFEFSKDLLSEGIEEYAFFTYPDAFGYLTPNSYQVYDNAAKRYVMTTGDISPLDSVRGKAMLQVVSADHLKR
jgi:phosphoglycerol transferase MdoB-like AlkP superfamily enzyme